MPNLKYRFLSNDFYNDYKNCPEIEHKKGRPYAIAIVSYNGLDFAIPFRSHINHQYAFFTTPLRDKGLDYSKAIPIIKKNYINNSYIPQNIDKAERAYLFNKATQVEAGLKQYINSYKRALNKQHIISYKNLCTYSALQYFHKELGIVS